MIGLEGRMRRRCDRLTGVEHYRAAARRGPKLMQCSRGAAPLRDGPALCTCGPAVTALPLQPWLPR